MRCPICITGTVLDGTCDGCLHGPYRDPPSDVLLQRPLLIACAHCGAPFDDSISPGRQKEYCSASCRQSAAWLRYREEHPAQVLTAAERSEKARKAGLAPRRLTVA